MPPKAIRAAVCSLLAVHLALVIVLAWRHSPSIDEAGHLASGARIWRQRCFDMYRVNPPLVRTIAAIPPLLLGAKIPEYIPTPNWRPEFRNGDAFLEQNPDRFRLYFFTARLACLPFSILGALICFWWARDLFGSIPGLAALAIWCFSPNMINWGSLFCPDLAAASTGLLAGYCFWRWLKRPIFSRTILCGLALGICELTKLTWVIFYPVLPLIWLVWMAAHSKKPIQYWHTAKSLLGIVIISLYMVNSFYLFSGTFRPLKDYQFRSRLCTELQEGKILGLPLGAIPLPFPNDYIQGVDLQKYDFESGRFDSYLLGKWNTKKGWWYYYLVAALVKVPIGTLALIFLAALLYRPKNTGGRSGGSDLFAALLPGIALFAFVSSETGFSCHFRYVIPALPFFYIFGSSVFIPGTVRKTRYLPWALLTWGAVSSLAVFPNTFSYFNEIAGGPKGGHRFLLDSSVEWQQNMYLLKAWQEANPDKKPLYTSYNGDCPPERFGIDSPGKPTPIESAAARFSEEASVNLGANRSAAPLGPEAVFPPGWYAISVHQLLYVDNTYVLFRGVEPVERLGGTIYIYHIEGEEPPGPSGEAR
ncbi:MAG: glycosyltransferase family 39 protein [Thermoguttaceae bacterium]|nr:glycosyltransferase family 39 protein [Thermoguttaceae bacterium]